MSDLLRAADALDALADAAAPGPWTVEEEHSNEPADSGFWLMGGGVRGSIDEHAVAVAPLYSPTAKADSALIAAVASPDRVRAVAALLRVIARADYDNSHSTIEHIEDAAEHLARLYVGSPD